MATPMAMPHSETIETWELPPECLPDVENLVTEDDTPVDNIFSEKQQRLLTEPLYTAWRPGKPFVALANVGLFFAAKQPPLVPDVLLSLGVGFPEELWQKHHRSYFVWEYGRPPDVAIEIVSNRKGDEAGTKIESYADIGISYYVLLDPIKRLSDTPLRVYKRIGGNYVETVERFFPEIGLGVVPWQGVYETVEAEWLRWCDQDKRPIPTGAELSETERERAEAERRRADLLAEKLRALGIDPDNIK